MTGAWTWMTMLRFQDDTVDSLIGFYTSPSTYRGSLYRDVDLLIHTDPGTAKSVTTFAAADDWIIVGLSKASGTVAPRCHYIKNAGDAFSHEVCTGTQQNFVGFNLPTISKADVHEMDVYWVALWNSELSDATIDSICPTGFMDDADLLATSPAAFWVFDQASVATSVTDETGNGANQSARTGTAVASGDIPYYVDAAGGGLYWVRA